MDGVVSLPLNFGYRHSDGYYCNGGYEMYKIPRQRYMEDFKCDAVRLVQYGHKTSSAVWQLGISEQTLGNWRKAAAAGKLAGSGQEGDTG